MHSVSTISGSKGSFAAARRSRNSRATECAAEERDACKAPCRLHVCDLVRAAGASISDQGLHAVVGATWTTDAPFRETEAAIEAARGRNILAVEMEAAALCAFAAAIGHRVPCLAHVTNTMGQTEQDFEKGEVGIGLSLAHRCEPAAGPLSLSDGRVLPSAPAGPAAAR